MHVSVRTLAALVAPSFLAVGLWVLPAGVARAQTPQQGAEADQEAAELSAKERKRLAKEQRIAEYLRKKEAKRAQREERRVERGEAEAQLALELERQQIAEEATADEPRSAARPLTGFGPPQLPKLPGDVVRAQTSVRQTPLGTNPTISGYLDLIDQRRASPRQVAAFANFLAQNGMNRIASTYYGFALSIVKDDPVLWVNAGTLHRQIGELSEATRAYKKAIALSHVNALAHYNLGAVMDQQGKYRKAIREYRLALTLDPSLGDPTVNPQAAHNPRLLAVKMLIYEEQIGSLGLPLVDVAGGSLGSADYAATEQ